MDIRDMINNCFQRGIPCLLLNRQILRAQESCRVSEVGLVMIWDSFENNLNPIDIIGSKTVAIIQKMKYRAIIMNPFIMALCFAAFSDILIFM